MKNTLIPTALTFVLAASPLFAQDSASKVSPIKISDHKDYAFKEGLWDTDIATFQKQYPNLRFEWQTAKKDSLRSAVAFPLFGQKSGETLVGSEDGKINRITFSVFNRGDHGGISTQNLLEKFKALKGSIDDATEEEHKDNSRKRGNIQLTSYFWKGDGTAYLLEMSSSQGQGEFLRLRMAPYGGVASTKNRTASRSDLKSNVVEADNGDVYIEGVPMVDQGQKGYCACASAARIFQYYGREISQHEVAQMSDASAASGTRIDGMVEGLKKAAGKLNFRVVVLYEYPKYISKPDMSQAQLKSTYRESASDVNKYQALAKKLDGKLLVINGEEGARIKTGWMCSIVSAQRGMDPEIYKQVMVKKSNYSRFKSSVKKYIDEGVPVAWCLQLGMFKEEGIPQMGGGHMRLIIGYNEDEETIIYTDSWGKGHAKKSMPIANAYCMTNVLLALPPTR